MTAYSGRLLHPDPLNTRQDKLNFIARNASTIWHYTGSCRAGRDPMNSVVDPNFRVWGIARLRIVDASVLPVIPSVNTHALVLTIAQLAATVLLKTPVAPHVAENVASICDATLRLADGSCSPASHT